MRCRRQVPRDTESLPQGRRLYDRVGWDRFPGRTAPDGQRARVMSKRISIPPPITVRAGANEFPQTFAQFVTQAMDAHQPNGRGIKQIRQAIKILATVETANEALTLEDADYELLNAA